jgi:hypothetical protein
VENKCDAIGCRDTANYLQSYGGMALLEAALRTFVQPGVAVVCTDSYGQEQLHHNYLLQIS